MKRKKDNLIVNADFNEKSTLKSNLSDMDSSASNELNSRVKRVKFNILNNEIKANKESETPKLISKISRSKTYDKDLNLVSLIEKIESLDILDSKIQKGKLQTIYENKTYPDKEDINNSMVSKTKPCLKDSFVATEKQNPTNRLPNI